MAERMLVTQALDERDLLVKKIRDKIKRLSIIDTIKPNEEKVYEARVSREEFAKDASSAYQQILDLIARFERIDAAIVASNAKTMISTSYGEFTVAGAISLRGRLRGTGTYELASGFETAILEKLEVDLHNKLATIELKNKQLQSTAEDMYLSILGKDTKARDEKPLEVVETYVRENKTELVDPLGIEKKIVELREKRETLLAELETQIKVSNATTFIEF